MPIHHDSAFQRVGQHLPDHPSAGQPTAVFHNLLRHRAELWPPSPTP